MLSKVNHSQNTYFDFIIQELIHKTRVSSRAEEALMAPKRRKTQHLSEDPHGMFAGMVVFLVEKGVQARRLQVLHVIIFLCHFVLQ